jgi:hypothetical protein
MKGSMFQLDRFSTQRSDSPLAIPEGRYTFEIARAELVTSSKTGKRQLALAFSGVDAGCSSLWIRRWFDLEDKQAALVARLCRLVAVQITSNMVDEKSLVGCRFSARLGYVDLAAGRRDYWLDDFERVDAARKPPAVDASGLRPQQEASARGGIPF